MEKRTAKVNISSAGGTAAKGAKTYKITMPNSWMNRMGVCDAERELEMTFSGNRIIISRRLSCEEFAAQKLALDHDVRSIQLFEEDKLCTTIYADFTDRELVTTDHIDDPVKTAFGNNKLPSWADFLTFLEERCVPRERAGIREYLEAIGLSGYDPLVIISKTSGRMAEDNQWLKMETLK